MINRTYWTRGESSGWRVYSFEAYSRTIRVFAMRKSDARSSAKWLYGEKYERYRGTPL